MSFPFALVPPYFVSILYKLTVRTSAANVIPLYSSTAVGTKISSYYNMAACSHFEIMASALASIAMRSDGPTGLISFLSTRFIAISNIETTGYQNVCAFILQAFDAIV